jgi:colicin import membrane protein
MQAMADVKTEAQANGQAFLLSALLHVGLVLFLLLATLSCTTWARVVGSLGLPEGWNPVTCSKPLSLAGPVIEATLMGPAGAPLPPPAKVTVEKPTVPPPTAKPEVPQEKPKVEPVKTLPPPPKQPDIKDQEKVVAEAQEKAEQAKREQQEREKQRMSELEAKQEQAKIDEIFKKLDAARQQSQKADKQAKLDQQKLAQLKDLKNAKAPPSEAPPADQARSGNAGTDTDLAAQYAAAIQSMVTQAWLRPDNIPAGLVCPIDIVQIPGGQVISAKVESNCPFDDAARRSVENAVMRAQPLPYKGFEKVFQREVTLNFKVEN